MILLLCCKRRGTERISYNRPCNFISTFIGDMTEQKKYQKKLFLCKKMGEQIIGLKRKKITKGKKTRLHQQYFSLFDL